MRVGYQGEEHSYSHRAVAEVLPGADAVGFHGFVEAFAAIRSGAVDRLVAPVENSTTGSVLPVLDRLAPRGEAPLWIVAEHLVEVRHALLGLPGADIARLSSVRSHPQALAQAEALLLDLGLEAVPASDTAGAVREVAAGGDPTVAALAPPEAAGPHGLDVLRPDAMDRPHNTTRFVVLAPDPGPVSAEADKTSIVFDTGHRPGALALALTELGLRGANLTRIESRPGDEPWTYRFFVDLLHQPGAAGRAAVLDPPPAALAHLHVIGTYPAAT